MRKRLPLALLGAGWVVRMGYLPHLMYGPFEVVSIYDPDPKTVEVLLPQLPRARVETSSQSCLKAPALATLIASSSPSHVKLSLEALRAGRYVLCEKPVAVRKSQVQKLARVEREGFRRLAGAAVCRHRPDIQQWISWSTRLKEVRKLDLVWLRAQGVPSPGSWHTRPSNGWTGVLMDLGYHLVDLAVAVLNHPVQVIRCLRAKAVSTGKGGAAAWYGPKAKSKYDVCDRVQALLQVDEVAINLQVSWIDDLPGDITRLRATGSDGVVEFKGLLGFSNQRRIADQRCRFIRGGKVIEEKSYLPGPELHREAFGGVLEEFAGVCRGAEPQVGLSQISATIALMEAINSATNKQ